MAFNRRSANLPAASKDLRKISAIDKANTGIDRSEYYTRRLHESLHESGVRVSLVAELEDYPVGFIMARVDFGEFGHTKACRV
jgi:hypothetical protein